MIRTLTIGLVLAGCTIKDVDYTGKTCPCPTGWACQEPSHVCVRDAGDGGIGDGRNDADLIDAAPQASCISGPFTTLAYSSPTFADYSTGWISTGGIWSHAGSEAVQASTSASLSILEHPFSTSNNYRIVATMRATSAGMGKAIELAARIDSTAVHMYHCNWEPDGGAFLIQRTDTINTGAVVVETTINTAAIPGYQIAMPVTMEFQISGNSFKCCLRGVAAEIQGNDATYATGNVGLKTYQMSGAYTGFSVYTL